jgi:hypothetical protein
MENPNARLTMGQNVRILHARGPGALIPSRERRLPASPGEPKEGS